LPKYSALSNLLASAPTKYTVLTMPFSELEGQTGIVLPNSAKNHRPWWANEGSNSRHSQCRAWLGVGFRVYTVNLLQQEVTFERVKPNSVTTR
jgi:hypothetical protein